MTFSSTVPVVDYKDTNAFALHMLRAKKNAEAVSTSDTVDLNVPSLIYIGVTGNVSVDLIGGGPSASGAGATAIVFKGAQAGTILPVIVKRVRATSTTATDMVAIHD